VVSLVAIALMSIEIDNHKALHAIPFLEVVRYKGDVWEDTKATSRDASRMMVTPAEIDRPSMLYCHASSIYTALCSTLHRLK